MRLICVFLMMMALNSAGGQEVSQPVGKAAVGRSVGVTLTQYCLKGTTRRDHAVREGIIAADSTVFPLGRYVKIFLGKVLMGRFLVDDTGSKVKGATLDIWTASCALARQFGRQRGEAVLVAEGPEE